MNPSFNTRSGARALVLAAITFTGLGFSTLHAADDAGQARLAQVLEAHGGLDKWQSFGTLAYTMKDFPLSEQIAQENRSTVDLVSRQNRIEGPGYTVGFDGENAWSVPGPKSSGLPSRFVNLGSFYFIGLPFVLADPGVNVADSGKSTFQGKEYDTLTVTFGEGVGHSDDDNYVVFIEPETNRVALIHHNVTELYDEATRVTWVYNGYTEVNGLQIPSKLTFYQGWNENPDPATGATYTVENIELKKDRPDNSIYQAPETASINDQ